MTNLEKNTKKNYWVIVSLILGIMAMVNTPYVRGDTYRIRVATWNIAPGERLSINPALRYPLDRVLQVITQASRRDMNIDIIALQEVDHSLLDDQAQMTQISNQAHRNGYSLLTMRDEYPPRIPGRTDNYSNRSVGGYMILYRGAWIDRILSPVLGPLGLPHYLSPDSFLARLGPGPSSSGIQRRPPVEVVFTLTTTAGHISQLNFITWHNEVNNGANASINAFLRNISQTTCPAPSGAYGPATWVLAGDLNVRNTSNVGIAFIQAMRDDNDNNHTLVRADNPGPDWIASNGIVIDDNLTLGDLRSEINTHLIVGATIEMGVTSRARP